MDPLYISDRDSRKRVWDGLVRIDAEARRRPRREVTPEVLRPPISIVEVLRDEKNTFSEPLELSYRYAAV